MKGVALLVVALAALAAGRPDISDKDLASMDIKQRQVMVLKLLNHIIDPVMYKDIEEIGKNFKIEDNVDMFTKSDVVKYFINCMKTGMLPRGEVFTATIDRQLKEAIAVFHMLYYAKDFAAFIKTACWMRMHINEGMFVYAFTVAVRHREDCKGLILPPPYEIYPYYFVRADVIQKAYMLKMKKGLVDPELCDFYGIKKTEKDIYIIDENIYDTRVALNEEDRIRYFTEDIDLNTYFYYFHVDYPMWMKDDLFDKLKTRRFELSLYLSQQILARYYLERLSTGLGPVHRFSWEKSIEGHWPWMKLHNGVELGKRANNYVLLRDDTTDVIEYVEACETIIREAILKGHIEINGLRLELTKPEDIENLGRIVFSNVDSAVTLDKPHQKSYRYLILILKSILGFNVIKQDSYFVSPSVLDNYQTALRDPVFYQLLKRIGDFVQLFKRKLPTYTKEELAFPGVKIDHVVVDKLVTYFEDYLMDMTNAVFLNDEELKKTTSDMKFVARKRRLNHQPFKMTIDVSSDKAVDCVVRIFMGPKEDNMGNMFDINANRLNFVEIDSFLYKLVNGKNTIVRDSKDMHNLVKDRIWTRDLWKRIESMTDMRDLLMKDLRNYHTGFPSRLLLPKGKVGGMKMMFYVILSPLKLVDNVDMNILDVDRKEFAIDFRSTVLLDKMPLGFPFDRRIEVSHFFTPNMKFVDVMVFHKQQACDMKTRWNRWVLRNYDMVKTGDNWQFNDNFNFVDADINDKIHDTRVQDL